MYSKILQFSFLSLILAFSACGGGSGSSGNNDDAGGPDAQVVAATSDFAETYADIAVAVYKDSLEGALTLQARIQELIRDPSEDTLKAAQAAWREAREPYGQSEVYRFYEDSPIEAIEGLVNAWPLNEGYIDYVADINLGFNEGDELKNIIDDVQFLPEITKESVAALNESGGERNITTGYHAIEFLLWGQDTNVVDGGGNRPASDYDNNVPAADQNNVDRRRKYLTVVTDLLIDHLEQLVNAWSENTPGNYRERFLNFSAEAVLQRALSGMTSLVGGELGSERMRNALRTGGQEDEHSCFSDNTHRDIFTNLQGVRNIYYGSYGGSVSGTGLNDLVELVDEDLKEQLDDQFDAALVLVNKISDLAVNDGAYFDLLIDPSKDEFNGELIQSTIDAVFAISDTIETAANNDFNLDINADPDGE